MHPEDWNITNGEKTEGGIFYLSEVKDGLKLMDL